MSLHQPSEICQIKVPSSITIKYHTQTLERVLISIFGNATERTRRLNMRPTAPAIIIYLSKTLNSHRVGCAQNSGLKRLFGSLSLSLSRPSETRAPSECDPVRNLTMLYIWLRMHPQDTHAHTDEMGEGTMAVAETKHT